MLTCMRETDPTAALAAAAAVDCCATRAARGPLGVTGRVACGAPPTANPALGGLEETEEACPRLLDIGRSKCSPRPMGTLAVLVASAARGIIPPPLPASNFFRASSADPAVRGVAGRATDATGRGTAPTSRATRDDDKPANEGPLRLLGRLLPVDAASVGAVEGAGGEPSSFRREIPSGRLNGGRGYEL